MGGSKPLSIRKLSVHLYLDGIGTLSVKVSQWEVLLGAVPVTFDTALSAVR